MHLLAVFGIVITVILVTKGVRSGVFLGMIITAIVGMIFNLVAVPTAIVSGQFLVLRQHLVRLLMHLLIQVIYLHGNMLIVILNLFIRILL